MEAELVRRESDLPYRGVPAAALRGRAPWTMARNGATLASGTLAAARLIRELRPQAILGTGGYVCVPIFLAARASGVPTAIYLPDVVPGLAVRFLARLATVTTCTVADSAAYFPGKIARRAANESQIVTIRDRRTLIVTGYPVRPDLFDLDRATCRAAFGLTETVPTVVVTGGSRGARSINRAIEALLPHLLPIAQVIHVCGREGDVAFLQAAAARLPEELGRRYHLFEYLHSARHEQQSMANALGAADLAVCRSGASTLGELPALGLPAVLVPYPYVHQDENANYLARHGAAHTVQDDAMLGGGAPQDGPLFRNVRRLLDNLDERQAMAERSRALGRPDAAGRLAEVLTTLAARRLPA
jgi:UDP-N-acetylglucosamine--N-acetylmuramyl-(pentapeptide) pyrophosphoryl-undecaprenol N-acetylglucosamine transferase